ncbi:MAG: dockerin type I domain-containing protein [Deltaproteobacteria bacterium]
MRLRVLCALGIATCAITPNAEAQTTGASPCFASSPIADWYAHDVGETVGASMPTGTTGTTGTTGGNGFRLCGDGDGYGPDDAIRVVGQDITGDFAVSALITDVDEGNEGGLEARTIVRAPDAPRFRITVSRAAGSVWLSAEARDGTTVASTPVPVSLPVAVRLSRSGSLLEASSNGVNLLTHDASGTALASATLTVSAAQGAPLAASGEVGFAQVALVDAALPPDAQCTEASDSPTGTTLTVFGSHLSQVLGVRVAGEPAQILTQSDSRLQVVAPRPSAAFASGAIILDTADRSIATGGRVAYAGAPFIRGDVDENGSVDNDDVSALSARLAGTDDVACVAAADIDADGDIDSADLSRLKRFVRFGIKPPAAPFPSPGYSSFPAPACGLGTAPTIASLTDGNGRPLGTASTIVEGDELSMHGSDLPTEGTDFYFGDVPMTRLPGSSSTLVRLRVGAVPSSGDKCPRLFEATDDTAHETSTFGLVREVRDDTLTRHLCPTFAASTSYVSSFQWNASANEGFLPVPANVVDPAAGVKVDLLLVRPAVTGLDRGSRRVSVSGRANDSAMSYASLLDDLARRLSKQLDGGAPSGCGTSDFVAIADPIAGGLFIRPTNTSPGGYPPPPPPHTSQIAKPRPPLDAGGAGGVQLAKPSCNDQNISPTSRLAAWCAFVRATELVDGYPRWEHSVPQHMIYESYQDILDMPEPNDRSVTHKRTMYNGATRTDLQLGGYLDACAQAARVSYCPFGGKRDWMPQFGTDAHVYKGFWRTLGELPASADPDDLYSYDPPDGPRQYLVGFHLSSGTNAQITYWNWATFWFPRGNDTLTKDGNPLEVEYNPTCTTGNFANQPNEVSGVWKNYVMCMNGEDGGTPCGNPWGPHDECKAESCRTCHLKVAIDFPGQNPTGELSTAWMGTWTRAAEVKACFDEIQAGVANNQTPYANLTPIECQ